MVADLRTMFRRWRTNPATFTPAAWRAFIQRQAPWPFLSGGVEVEADLWGDFWEGDVIGPGYVLPLLELAFLRATRLEETFVGPTPQDYLQALNERLIQFPLGAWAARFGPEEVLCAVFQTRPKAPATSRALFCLIWLVDGVIAAGYQDVFVDSPGYNLQPLRPLAPPLSAPRPQPPLAGWFDALPEWHQQWPRLNRAAQIDRLIRLHRAYSRLADSPERAEIGRWLTAHGA